MLDCSMPTNGQTMMGAPAGYILAQQGSAASTQGGHPGTPQDSDCISEESVPGRLDAALASMCRCNLLVVVALRDLRFCAAGWTAELPVQAFLPGHRRQCSRSSLLTHRVAGSMELALLPAATASTPVSPDRSPRPSFPWALQQRPASFSAAPAALERSASGAPQPPRALTQGN